MALITVSPNVLTMELAYCFMCEKNTCNGYHLRISPTYTDINATKGLWPDDTSGQGYSQTLPRRVGIWDPGYIND